MLNVSHNRIDHVQALASLQALIAANFGRYLGSGGPFVLEAEPRSSSERIPLIICLFLSLSES